MCSDYHDLYYDYYSIKSDAKKDIMLVSNLDSRNRFATSKKLHLESRKIYYY